LLVLASGTVCAAAAAAAAPPAAAVHRSWEFSVFKATT
jgi:hypothetical protein